MPPAVVQKQEPQSNKSTLLLPKVNRNGTPEIPISLFCPHPCPSTHFSGYIREESIAILTTGCRFDPDLRDRSVVIKAFWGEIQAISASLFFICKGGWLKTLFHHMTFPTKASTFDSYLFFLYIPKSNIIHRDIELDVYIYSLTQNSTTYIVW